MTFHFNSKLKELDGKLDGLETGRVYYAASTCGSEATALLNAIVLCVGESNNNVSYLSLYQKAPATFFELLAFESNIPCSVLKKNYSAAKDFVAKLSSYPIRIDDEDYFEEQDLFTKLRCYVEIGGARLIIIDRLDYAQFFMKSNYAELFELFNNIRDFARENDICIVISLPAKLAPNCPDTKIYLENIETFNTPLLNVYVNKDLLYTPLSFISECTKIIEGVVN